MAGGDTGRNTEIWHHRGSVGLVENRVGIVTMFMMMVFPSLHSGILVPGGFGVRGTEGKIHAINWARKQKKPFLGRELSVSVAGSYEDAVFTSRNKLHLRMEFKAFHSHSFMYVQC